MRTRSIKKQVWLNSIENGLSVISTLWKHKGYYKL